MANRLLQDNTTPTPPLPHSYSQPATSDRPKLRLHSSWEPSPRYLEPFTHCSWATPLHPGDDPDDDVLRSQNTEDSNTGSSYPWDDSEDDSTPTQPQRKYSHPPPQPYPWSDSESSSEPLVNQPPSHADTVRENSSQTSSLLQTSPAASLLRSSSTTTNCSAPTRYTSPTPSTPKEPEDILHRATLLRPREPK